MSLLKKRQMTEKRLAALRKSQQRSHSPEAAERRKRANLRRGIHSQAENVALSALGENPAEFQEMLAGLRDQGTAVSTLQQQIGNRLARAIWRMNRADRMQEGYALRQSKEVDHGREGRLHLQMMRLKMISATWELLAKAVANKDYRTRREDLDMMTNLHNEGVAKGMSEVALALFYQLREPRAPLPGTQAFDTLEDRESAERVVTQVRAIFGPSTMPEHKDESEVRDRMFGPNNQPGVASGADQQGVQTESGQPSGPDAEAEDACSGLTEEEWAARQRVRQLLENILNRQVEMLKAQRQDLLRQSIDGPSPYERAAEIVPTQPEIKFMQRMEDSNCRQVLRLSNLLIRLRQHEWQLPVLDESDVCAEVTEMKAS
jgi:hypothetical protein